MPILILDTCCLWSTCKQVFSSSSSKSTFLPPGRLLPGNATMPFPVLKTPLCPKFLFHQPPSTDQATCNPSKPSKPSKSLNPKDFSVRSSKSTGRTRLPTSPCARPSSGFSPQAACTPTAPSERRPKRTKPSFCGRKMLTRLTGQSLMRT
jgi:hypothetical protein